VCKHLAGKELKVFNKCIGGVMGSLEIELSVL
jgi:hypothetical protein